MNRQSLAMARSDNLADPEVLASVCGYHAAPLAARLQEKEVLTGDEVQALLEEHQHLRAKD